MALMTKIFVIAFIFTAIYSSKKASREGAEFASNDYVAVDNDVREADSSSKTDAANDVTKKADAGRTMLQRLLMIRL